MTKAIILAAGQGKRLHPYTINLPKCMVEIGGKPLVQYQIDVLRNAGIQDINFVGGYMIEKLKSFNIPIYENRFFDSTNMLFSLFCAKELFNHKEDLIISYGDIVYSPEILKQLIESTLPISVVIDENWKEYWESRFENVLDDAESLVLKNGDEIVEIGSRITNVSQIQGQYVGLIKLSGIGRDIFLQNYELLKSMLVNGKEFSNAYMTDFLQELINRGEKVNAIKTNSPWIEIDCCSDLSLDTTLARLKVIESFYV
jgi:choline kinase